MLLINMFEEIISGAIQMLIFIFWVTIAFIIIGGAVWVHVNKQAR